jgi:hypothetical protein
MEKYSSGSSKLAKASLASERRLQQKHPFHARHTKTNWPHDLGQLFDLCSDYFIRY